RLASVNNYPAARDKPPLFDLITARGFKPQETSAVPSWIDALNELEPFDLAFGTPSDDSFTIRCTPYQMTGACTPGAVDVPSSYWKAIAMLIDGRAIDSVPNLYARYAAAESRVRTKPDVDTALAAAGIGDPDGELRKTTGELVRQAFATSGMQDYRLLAIPQPGEQLAPDMYGGYELAQPP